jgi:hypothetical protein
MIGTNRVAARMGGRSRQGIGRTGFWLTVLMFAIAALAGCDESKNCFPLGGSCTDASGFSDFFEQGLGCCEGTCVQTSGPPVSTGVVVRLCQ